MTVVTAVERQVPGLCRVTVVAPTARVDLALPADLPLAAMLADLVELATRGEAASTGGAEHGGWCLSRPGLAELNPARTLDSLGILDGDLLQLRPRVAATPAPVFDDVVDLIATSTRTHMHGWTPAWTRRTGALSTVLLELLAALALLRSGPQGTGAAAAGAAALVLTALGAATARGYGERLAGLALGAGAVPFAVVAGLLTVPGPTGLLLGCALALLAAGLGAVGTGQGVAVFTAATVAATLVGLAALVAVYVDAPIAAIAASTLCAAVALVTVLPRGAVRLARLPLPFIAADAADLRGADDDIADAELGTRARLGRDYLLGALAACVAVAAGSCVVLAGTRRPDAVTLAALGFLAIALPARRTADAVQRILRLGAAGAATAAAAAGLAATGDDRVGLWVFAGALGAAALVAIGTATAHRVRVAPTTRRLSDLVEVATMCALLPLAALMTGLYSAVRHR